MNDEMFHLYYLKALIEDYTMSEKLTQACAERIAQLKRSQNNEGHNALLAWYTRTYPQLTNAERTLIWMQVAEQLLIPDAPQSFGVYVREMKPFIYDFRSLEIIRLITDMEYADVHGRHFLHFNANAEPGERLKPIKPAVLLRWLANNLSIDRFDRAIFRAQFIQQKKVMPSLEASKLVEEAAQQHEMAHRFKEQYSDN